MTPVLQLEGVSKRWPQTAGPLLDGVDLSVAEGECVALSGRNGAGKTTLLRVAAGLIRPDGGTVRILGRELEDDRRSCLRRVGFLAAGNSGLYGRLTLEQHVHLWARLALVPRAERPACVDHATARFALRELAGKRVDRLSMGQRQRVRLALSFLHRPRLLLLDEPRTSLDDDGAGLLREAVAEALQEGAAVVVCSPLGEEQGIPADRVLRVEDGALQA